MFGWTIHSFAHGGGRVSAVVLHARTLGEGAHPDVVVLAAGREAVGLGGELLVLRWARLLERGGLEVAGGDRLRVVPADFERADAHRGRGVRTGLALVVGWGGWV